MLKRKNVSPLYDYFVADSEDKQKMKCVIGDCVKQVSISLNEKFSLNFNVSNF